MSTAAKELPACPVETTLTLISDKWEGVDPPGPDAGTKRFGELKKSIGTVSQKVLTAQLRQMEESGLLTRKVYPRCRPGWSIPSRLWRSPCGPSWLPWSRWGSAYKASLEQGEASTQA